MMTNDDREKAAEPVVYACNLGALTPEQRHAHGRLVVQLFGPLLEQTRELPDGYAYGFAAAHYALLADFIANERRCCPFLTFTLIVAGADGPIWLHLTAPGDIKPFLHEELGGFSAATGAHNDRSEEGSSS